MLLCIESNGSMIFGMEMLLVKPHVQDQSDKELVNIASNWGYGEGKALEFIQCLWFEKVRFNCKEGSKSEQNGYRNCDGVVKFTIIYPKKKIGCKNILKGYLNGFWFDLKQYLVSLSYGKYWIFNVLKGCDLVRWQVLSTKSDML